MTEHRPFWLKRLTTRYGPRAVLLWLIGILCVMLGTAVSQTPFDPVPDVYHTHLPVAVRAGIWITCGLLAVLVSSRNAQVKIKGKCYRVQYVGFGFLILAPAQRLVSFLIAVGINVWQWDWAELWIRASSSVIYAIWVLVLLVCAIWPDPPKETE